MLNYDKTYFFAIPN